MLISGVALVLIKPSERQDLCACEGGEAFEPVRSNESGTAWHSALDGFVLGSQSVNICMF